MSGFYPDVPGQRMAWDIDGSVGIAVKRSNGQGTSLSQAEMTAMNEETTTSVVSGFVGGPGIRAELQDASYFGVVFPQARDLKGVFARVTDTMTCTLQVSTNSTNLIDGTWVNLGSAINRQWGGSGGSVSPYYRTQIEAAANNGIRAVRVALTSGSNVFVQAFHLYGSISSGETPDRLALWHPTLDQPLSASPAHLDFGDMQRGQTVTKQFRIKNLSPDLTASTVAVSLAAPTDADPSLLSQFMLSEDGSTYSAELTLPSIGPQSISAPLWVRSAVPADGQLGVWALRLTAAPANWS